MRSPRSASFRIRRRSIAPAAPCVSIIHPISIFLVWAAPAAFLRPPTATSSPTCNRGGTRRSTFECWASAPGMISLPRGAYRGCGSCRRSGRFRKTFRRTSTSSSRCRRPSP